MAGLRIGGLASGMDIDSIVSDLMKAERMPLDKIKQEKQILEWQRDDYRKMNTLLLDFRSELTQMKMTTRYRARTVTSSNEALATATASSAASQGNYTISQVTSLASSAYRVSGNISDGTGPKVDAAKSLDSQTTSFGTDLTWKQGSVESKTLSGNGSTTGLSLGFTNGEKIILSELPLMSVKVDGVSYDVLADTGTIDPSKNQVKIDADGKLTFSNTIKEGATIKVDYVADKKVQSSTLTASATTFQLAKTNILNDAQFTLNIGGKDYSVDADGTTLKSGDGTTIGSLNKETGLITFSSAQTSGTTIKATYRQNYSDFSITSQTSSGQVKENFLIQSSDTLNQVISKVNASKAGVSMLYDAASDKISLTRKETGDFSGASGGEMTISGSLDNALGLNSATEQGGEKASFTINGLTTTRQSNTFDMNGVTITLKKADPTGTLNETTTLSINNDGNTVYDNIKSFVDKYNTLIEAINKKVTEDKYRSYTPLTDEQREQLSEKQQEQWEEKAKSGLLRRDSILTGVLSSMRSDFYQPVSNSDINPLFKQLASIGITTSSNYLEGGKLVISESKLKEAINNNPEAVEALFRGGSDATQDSERGIIHRLYDSVNETMDKLKERAGNSNSTLQQFTLGRTLSSIEDRIDRFEDRMKQVEDRYWRQFTAMEKAIQQANSQSAYLMQQFSY